MDRKQITDKLETLEDMTLKIEEAKKRHDNQKAMKRVSYSSKMTSTGRKRKY